MNTKKNTTFRYMIGIFIIVAIIFAIYFYESSSNNNNVFIIGMSQSNLYEPWRLCMNKEIEEEAKKHDNLKVIYKDAGGDSEKQKKDIEDLINFGADLLIVSINDSKQLAEVIKKAHESTPVIILDRAAPEDDYTLYIGSDTKAIGIQAGKMIVELAGNKNVKVIEVQGILNSSSDEEITSGFKDLVSKYKNINIDRTIVANWQKSEAQDKIEAILKEDKDVDIIFAHSDYMALGAYYAKVSTKADNVKIIGIDGLNGREGGIELVKDGILQGTFTCKTGGKEAVDYALKILNKKDDVPKKVILECNKITKESLKN
jgi:ABC-type sugar transport system substrate-binding protein